MADENRFVTTIQENEGIIFKVAMIYAKDKDDQKDLYQEILYQLWKSFDSFRGEAKVSTWMYRIALNTSISFLAKQKRRVDKIAVNHIIPDRIDETDTITEERIQVLNAHIQKLNEIEKGLVLLHLEGKNYEEIAAITGFTASNVGTRLSRLKQKLKSQIKE